MMRLMVAGVAAGLPLGAAIADLQSETRADVTQLCENAIGDKGYKGYRFEDIEFNEARSGYSVTGQISRGSHRYEFNCVVSTRMSITDLVINPLSGDDDSRSVNSGAPAEAQVACAEEADKYWGLKDGASVPGKSKSTGSGMYEVQVAGGHHRGICTVTEDGDVKGIMNQ
ncbi:MAG: hypothetical protein KDJ31_03610 [Candidatus Competibacteraceae bacterium]|nr:hypothetical protein [Candidatus Competibacteraceae bacterium]HRY15366.1 hypothetical protein [Candidatus Competibacteraceae bacterium]